MCILKGSVGLKRVCESRIPRDGRRGPLKASVKVHLCFYGHSLIRLISKTFSVAQIIEPARKRSYKFVENRPHSYSQHWTGTSLQWRLMRGNLLKCK